MGARRRAAFTLIELLVVIAIIAVLAAILFPVFMKAREGGRIGKCVSNLRQIGQALQAYRDAYDGRNCWIWQHEHQKPGAADNDQGSFFWVITHFVGQKFDYENEGVGNKERHNVYKCPSAPWLQQKWSTTYSRENVGFAYNMNETGWTDRRYRIFAGGGLHDSEFKRPAQIIFVAEAMGWSYGVAYQDGSIVDNENPKGGLRSGDGWTSVHPAPEEPIPLSDPSYLGEHHGSKSKIYNLRTSHNMGANLLFYDGHVRCMQFTRGRNWSVAY